MRWKIALQKMSVWLMQQGANHAALRRATPGAFSPVALQPLESTQESDD